MDYICSDANFNSFSENFRLSYIPFIFKGKESIKI